MTSERPQVTPTGRYTAIHASKVLGVNKCTIYRWIDNGTFEPHEVAVNRYGHKGIFIYGHGILRVWEATEEE